MIERNDIPAIFDIYNKEDLNGIAPAIALHMFKGHVIDITINLNTDEFDTMHYKTTSSTKNQGGWRKHTYKIILSGKRSLHIKSKPQETNELYIVSYRPNNFYFNPSEILSPIYWELGILEGRIIVENVTIKIEKDVLSIIERFNEILKVYNSSTDKKVISYVFRIDTVVENDKEISNMVELLTKLTVLKFAPDNDKIKINYTFNINIVNAVNLEGIPIKAGKYNSRLINKYEFRLEDENSNEVSLDYKIPSKGYSKNEVRSYKSGNLIREKVRKAIWGYDYIRPDETDKLCTDGLKAFTIETHTFVRDL